MSCGTYRLVHQVQPVVEIVEEAEGIWDVVSLRAEDQQHRQRDVLCTTKWVGTMVNGTAQILPSFL